MIPKLHETLKFNDKNNQSKRRQGRKENRTQDRRRVMHKKMVDLNTIIPAITLTVSGRSFPERKQRL